jgi:hypothetical protein
MHACGTATKRQQKKQTHLAAAASVGASSGGDSVRAAAPPSSADRRPDTAHALCEKRGSGVAITRGCIMLQLVADAAIARRGPPLLGAVNCMAAATERGVGDVCVCVITTRRGESVFRKRETTQQHHAFFQSMPLQMQWPCHARAAHLR